MFINANFNLKTLTAVHVVAKSRREILIILDDKIIAAEELTFVPAQDVKLNEVAHLFHRWEECQSSESIILKDVPPPDIRFGSYNFTFGKLFSTKANRSVVFTEFESTAVYDAYPNSSNPEITMEEMVRGLLRVVEKYVYETPETPTVQ